MKSQVDQVIHAAIRKPEETTRVLYIGYNGWFESLFAGTSITCYMSEDTGMYEWTGKLPQNFNILPRGMSFIPNRIDVDAIVCNSRRNQVFQAATIADAYHLPLILIEHELPGATANEKLRKYVNSRLPSRCVHVFPRQFVKDEWHMGDERESYVIPYGIPVPKQALRQNNVAVVGDYSPADYSLLETMMNCNPEVIGMGNNPGMTTPYTELADIVRVLSESYLCVTASNESAPPFMALLGMACGALTITNRTRWTEQIIEDGRTGFLFDKSTDIKKIVKTVLADREKMENVALRGQKHIVKNYPMSSFIESWHELIHTLISRTYKR